MLLCINFRPVIHLLTAAQICLLHCFILPASAQQSAPMDSSFANNNYLHRVALFKQLPQSENDIVFLGNSLTEAGAWAELAGNPNIKNRGISGDVTWGLIARLDELLTVPPAKIFILTGTNDLKRGVPIEVITQQFRRLLIAVKTKAPKTKIYLQSVFPVNEYMTAPAYKKITNALVLALNKKLAALAPVYGAQYVHVHEILTDNTGNLKKEFTPDGIHLWPDAYIHWVRYLQAKKYL